MGPRNVESVAQLSGEQKAAILVVMLGEEASGKMLEHLSKRDVARIAREVADLGAIDPALSNAVLEEYYLGALNAPQFQGGRDVARRLLSMAEIEEEIVDKLISDASSSSDDLLGPLLEAPPEVLAAALQDEHPQTTALVLLHLPPPRAALLLAALDDERRAETVLRMATLRLVRNDLLDDVAESLQQRLIHARRAAETGDGIMRTIAILEKMSRADTRRLLDELEEEHPEEVQQMRDALYTFESLELVDDKGMQELLRQVDSSRLALSLTGQSELLVERVVKNLSERAASMLKEEMEFLDSPNEDDRAAAQKEVLDAALKLESEGLLKFLEPDDANDDAE